ncbi:hypothetical protein SETIT_1G182600v2 [Setaria italica]|uniref:CCHC-type domain-containing protein n=1 Tax=Setaria italica TaxID=4555 RepID=A0A368PM44_SETIT|nr:serine/arginine-rich splicing factor 4 [Setaria italica]RCV06683.1 hypothetical protein SETIT_1G182600v2 [Setaria italica]
MSLHIGRLSQDVRHSYLEQLFQRFGRCTVNLKDGYGFAVYDSDGDATRALRALHGKYVCGERITVNWSKQQPRCSQGFRRSSRFVESFRGRNVRDARDSIRFRDSVARKSHPANHDQGHDPDAVPEKDSHKFTEVVDDAGENICDDLADAKRDEGGTIDEDPGEVKTDKGGTIDVDPEEVKAYKGGTIDEDPGEVKAGEGGTINANAIEHDRWAETGKGTPGGDSDDFDRYEPYHGYDRQEETENVTKASSYDSREPRRSSEKWWEHSDKHVDVSHDKSRSPPTCYKCGVAGHIARNCPQGIDDNFKARRDGLNFREKWQLRQRRFGSPSRRRPEVHVHPLDQTNHRVQDGRKPFSERNMRLPRLSNVLRDSRRHAHCSENMPQTNKEAHKRSRSERSRGSSPNSEPSSHSHHDNVKGSHSNRTSSDSRSRSPRSQSRFRAHSPSYSAHSSSKSTQHEGSRSNINHPVPFSVSASPQHKSSPDVENKNLEGLMNSRLEDNLEFRTRSKVKNMDDNKQEGKESVLNSKVLNGEVVVPDKDANTADYTGVNFDKNLVDDNAANRVQSQNVNFENSSSVKSKQDVLARNGRSKSLKLTTNEVIAALKHYGMEPQENSSDQPVEKYFGAARLWPWEIIYYRRRKKGPISTENYAKRVEQNKEFGIVDQYVRSSTGWWECP